MRIIFIILLGAILASNTFSPQYLVWVAPFVAFLTDLEAGLFISASFMTWFYFRYWDDVISLAPMATSLLIARNILLLILLVVSISKLVRRKYVKWF